MPADLSRRSVAKTDENAFPVFILGWTRGGKAAEGCRSPKPDGGSERPRQTRSVLAPALWRFGLDDLGVIRRVFVPPAFAIRAGERPSAVQNRFPVSPGFHLVNGLQRMVVQNVLVEALDFVRVKIIQADVVVNRDDGQFIVHQEGFRLLEKLLRVAGCRSVRWLR